MEKLGLYEIRKSFLDFFETKGHLVAPSFPLVPQNDNSLLLINAGMAPLKPYFSGLEVPPRKRMATCQKCVRTGDIENVGKTARHVTFFEMLGNFSFGDYFKREAIHWSWEYVTQVLKLPVERLWVSVYLEDDEAYRIWNEEVGIPTDRIVKLGKDDNFWEIDLGPCGPCSEIYFDRGPQYGCDCEDCKPGCDCDRYIEFWNLVFTQFDKDAQGNYNPLPNPNIDTGMGLERIACIMQEVDSIFEVDTMKYILDQVCTAMNSQYGVNQKTDLSLRIITDHLRTVTFMVGDGIIPSNEGRGYVLRRLLRRAARHGKLLGKTGTFLHELVDAVIHTYGAAYPELVEKREYIQRVLRVEEERFQETIDQGMDILNQYIEALEQSQGNILKGEEAFRLYDTFGFPLDLTKEILAEKGMDVDEEGFKAEMEKQRERARTARQGSDIEGWKRDDFAGLDSDIQSHFIGYHQLEGLGTVKALLKDHGTVDRIEAGDSAIVILDETTFYGESGGQVGDKGLLLKEGFKAKVVDTKKGANQRIHLMVQVETGSLAVGDQVTGAVDQDLRSSTSRNHTATHLLHKALKLVLGSHVQQAGSLVTPERLRFDFTHFQGVERDQLKEVERVVNEQILAAQPVRIFETSINEARAMGAEALFGEKYGEVVRVVQSGDFSIELCGGCHVGNTSEIGLFIILSETGIAAGTRRIEALTGKEAYRYVKEQEAVLAKAAEIVKTQENALLGRLEGLMADLKEKEREIERLKGQLASGATEGLLQQAKTYGEAKVILHHQGEGTMDDLRKVMDILKEKISTGVILLASEQDGKANFVAAVTKDLVAKGLHAGNLVKEAAKITGGGGGGRPDMAQAGGKEPGKIGEALAAVQNILEGQLKA